MADFASIEPLDQQATAAEDRAISLAGSSSSLADKLRSAVAGRFQESPIAQQRDVALKEFITTAPNARANIAEQVRGGTIFNPNQQQAIIASKQAANVVPLLSLNDLLTAQNGTMADVIGSGINAFKAQSDAANTAASIARSRAESAYDRSLKERELALKSAGSAPSALEQLIMKYITGQQSTDTQDASSQVAEPAPAGIPSEDFQARASGGIRSPGGQWLFNRQTQSWQPSTIPETQYNRGQIIEDDQTGQRLVFDGRGWVPQEQYINSLGFVQKLFGGL